MKRLQSNTEGLVQYGISSDLAHRAATSGLTVTKARALSLKDLEVQFSLTLGEARTLKEAVQRQPIETETLYLLLERSNYICNICHGAKGSAFIVHHIEPYAKTQSNEYLNLIVLCPNDHDLAHGSGLTMSISKDELWRAKNKWESQVEKADAAKAAQAVEIKEDAVDYINVRRIEELCLQLFSKIPKTRATESLIFKGIIDEYGTFQQQYHAGRRFLFDYMNSGEALHYRDLMANIAQKIHFDDLSAAVDGGKRKVVVMEGHYAFFIGGVLSKRPKLPITLSTPAVLMHYTRRKIRVEWSLDPNFLFSMSAICRQGKKNRYIIYCLVRTVDTDSKPGQVLVTASPLLIAQPSIYHNRIPVVGWADRYSEYADGEPTNVLLDERGSSSTGEQRTE
jgi:hypothetical protein